MNIINKIYRSKNTLLEMLDNVSRLKNIKILLLMKLMLCINQWIKKLQLKG